LRKEIFMWNPPTPEQLRKIPRLYETESVEAKDKIIYAHFFIGGCDWYIAEFDGDDLFFGYAILNNDYDNAEWGYVSLNELQSIKVGWVEIDHDLHWEIKKASEIEKIRV